MFIAHTQGEEPKLLERVAVLLLLNCTNLEAGTSIGFQIQSWAHCELSQTLRLTEGAKNPDCKTSMAKVFTMWFPPTQIHNVQISGMGSSLTTHP